MAAYTSAGVMPKTSTRDTTSKVPLYLSELHMYGSSRLGIWSRNVNMDVLPTGGGTVPLLGSAGIDTFNRGNKFFELANHLGNVLVTVSDRKIGQSPVNNLYTSFTADVVSATDYAPFGMQMVGRSFDAAGSTGYRYGFNGKENDSEVKGEGNQQDYGMRIYDPRLGKFLSVDPLTKEYPWNSTYAFAEGSPIKYIDLDGLEKAKHWYDYEFSDLMSLMQEMKWSGWSKQQGIPYTLVDVTNRSFNPVGIGSHFLYTMATGEDLITHQPSSRVDALGNVVIAGIFHQAGVKLAKPSVAVQLEKQLGAHSIAPQTTKEISKAISLKNAKPQSGENFGSVGYSLENGKVNLSRRSTTNGTFDFVVTNEGKLVIGQGHYNLSGEALSVKAAGQMRIVKGQVLDINNSSGHYQPTVSEASGFRDILKSLGVDVSKAKLNIYNKEGTKVETKTF
jgi:RHS repeat-associated protein